MKRCLMNDNSDLISYNELNKDSNGGTEITTRGMFARLDRADLEGIQIITSRVRELDHNKLLFNHYYLHKILKYS